MAQFSEDDEGKSVVVDGDEVGIVSEVEHGTSYVDPDPGIADKVKAKLDWGDRDEDTYPLQEQAVETIMDDEIRLRSNP